MAQIKVMKLWNAFVTGFLALCTALGLITVTATAAAATTRVEATSTNTVAAATTPAVSPGPSPGPCPHDEAAHPRRGPRQVPSCRHRPPTDTDETTEPTNSLEPAHTDQAAPLQR